MNEQTHPHWSDLDLERYHDGEQPPEQRAALTADLFADEALRDRLDRVSAVDELGRRALLSDVQPIAGAFPLSRGARRAILATAATLALVVIGAATRTWWWRFPEPPVVSVAPAQAAQQAMVTPRTYSQERLVLSIPVSAEFRFASLRHAAPAPKLSPEEQAIQSAIARGDAEKALRLLARSEVKDRSAEWSKLGQMMQSAQRARAAILLLPINQQIEIVRAWSATPSLRPVVFERLEELLRDPESASAAHALRNELAMKPQLSGWVQSYAAAR